MKLRRVRARGRDRPAVDPRRPPASAHEPGYHRGPFALSDRTILSIWGITILLLVASVPFFNYADKPRRLIGAAATLVAFLMIRSVSNAQERNHAETVHMIDAVAGAVRGRHMSRPARPAEPDDPIDDATGAALAAAQTALLLDKLRRERSERKHG